MALMARNKDTEEKPDARKDLNRSPSFLYFNRNLSKQNELVQLTSLISKIISFVKCFTYYTDSLFIQSTLSYNLRLRPQLTL